MRVSAEDLMSLAAERGSTPMQVGAVLTFDVGLDPVLVAAAFRRRIAAVPRLRQCLVALPWGCGRPIWVDDTDFDLDRHFGVVQCPAPSGEGAVLAVAADLLLARLPRDRPLWAARLVTDTGHGGAALIIVFHHVLADGIGGLAVLASLVDGAAEVVDAGFPHRRPALLTLAVEALATRLRSVGRWPAMLRRLAGGAVQLRPALHLRAARCSLNTPTGPRRRLGAVRVDLARVRRAAHAQQATASDAALTAIAAALHGLLAARGEQVDRFVISVPFSTRRQTSASDLGNHSGVIPLRVLAVGDPVRRLTAVAETTRAAKQAQRGASTALLSPLFRLLAVVGLYRLFIDRQRMVHTFVTNLRGPQDRLTFLHEPISAITPLTSATGNVTVCFAVLSYAGSLTVTVNADPDTCPDWAELRDAVCEELRVLTASTVW